MQGGEITFSGKILIVVILCGTWKLSVKNWMPRVLVDLSFKIRMNANWSLTLTGGVSASVPTPWTPCHNKEIQYTHIHAQ